MMMRMTRMVEKAADLEAYLIDKSRENHESKGNGTA